MKKRTSILTFFCLLMLAHADIKAQTSKLIHYWNFNNINTSYNNPNIPDFHPNFSAIDTNKASVVYQLMPGTSSTYAGYIDDVTGDTTNARMGDTAGNGLRLRNPSDSMELRLYIPTNGYHGHVVIKYALQSSSAKSGQLAQLFDYSIDSGSTWTTNNLSMTIDSVNQSQFIDPSWGLISVNFGTDTSMSNNDKFVFRIKFAGNTDKTKGNNRFDNLTVEIDTFATSVNSISSNNDQYSLYPNPAQNTLNIVTPDQGNKIVSVYNLSGKLLMTSAQTNKHIQLNVASLPQGYYYAYIADGQRTKVMTFIKQ